MTVEDAPAEVSIVDLIQSIRLSQSRRKLGCEWHLVATRNGLASVTAIVCCAIAFSQRCCREERQISRWSSRTYGEVRPGPEIELQRSNKTGVSVAKCHTGPINNRGGSFVPHSAVFSDAQRRSLLTPRHDLVRVNMAKQPTRQTAAEARQTISDIARGMQHAVNTTQEMLQQQTLKSMEKFFDFNGNPLTTVFKVDKDRVIEAPWIALAPQSALKLDEMSLEFSIRVHGEKVKSIDMKNQHLDRSSIAVTLSGSRDNAGADDTVIDVSMKFKATETPEAVSRVVDEFTRSVTPRARTPEDDQPQTF